MNENTIKFKLKSNDKEIEITGEIMEDNTITRMGKPLLCNCSGNTEETATPYLFNKNNKEVYCPNCGKQSTEVTTFEDYENNELENIHLNYFGTDYITLQKLYKVSYTLPYDKWKLVEDLFMKLTPDMVDLGEFDPNFVGWVTSNPEEVENRLDVKQELRINYHKEKQLNDKIKEQENKQKQQQVLEEILGEFSIVDTPESPSKDGMFEVDGTIVDNPLNPWNEYGGGERFILTLDKIWYIRNNSRDTDNWDFNNIKIKGSYGAIGKYVLYDEELADKIMSLKKKE